MASLQELQHNVENGELFSLPHDSDPFLSLTIYLTHEPLTHDSKSKDLIQIAAGTRSKYITKMCSCKNKKEMPCFCHDKGMGNGLIAKACKNRHSRDFFPMTLPPSSLTIYNAYKPCDSKYESLTLTASCIGCENIT